jgi:hypothetical protein
MRYTIYKKNGFHIQASAHYLAKIFPSISAFFSAVFAARNLWRGKDISSDDISQALWL